MRGVGPWGTAMKTFLQGLLWGIGFWLAEPLALWLRTLPGRLGVH